MNEQPTKLRVMPGDEEKQRHELERELERELHNLDLPPEKKDSPDLSVAKEGRDLIPRSKASFEGHISQLSQKIEAINKDIQAARNVRDAAYAKADEEYRKRVHELERDLYEVKALRGAVELAIVALG